MFPALRGEKIRAILRRSSTAGDDANADDARQNSRAAGGHIACVPRHQCSDLPSGSTFARWWRRPSKTFGARRERRVGSRLAEDATNTRNLTLAALALALSGPAVACGPDDLSAQISRAAWDNPCRTETCWTLKGAAVLDQRCAQPVIVTLRVTGYDAAGVPRVTNEIIPFGVRPVRRGQHAVSLDHLLDHDPAVTAFGLEVVEVRGPLQ